MAQINSKEDAFECIFQAAKENRTVYDSRETFSNSEIEKYRGKYPFMANVTILDYLRWLTAKVGKIRRDEPKPTAEQFWRAAYEFDPLSLPRGTRTELWKIISGKNLKSVPLGWLNGVKLELILGIGALPSTEKDKIPGLRFAATDSGAILYSDGHPSEADEPYTMVETEPEDRLHRLASLGWVIQVESDGSWRKTGHVLVMDMDKGRKRHPWLVLASEWPADIEEAEEGFTIYADKETIHGDTTQRGVLPGGNSRTPVAKVHVPKAEGPSDLPILQRFGPNFVFEVIRFGDRRTNLTLAHVMDWYWDPATGQEVCFDRDGEICMRYDPQTKEYLYFTVESPRRSKTLPP